MKTTFITGATGFVGSSLARVLLAQGIGVRALARPDSDRTRLAGLPVDWVEGDILQPESLNGRFHQCDWLIHAAGRLGEAGVPEAAYQRLHVDGTRHVLSEAERTYRDGMGCRRILHVSSPGVLGPMPAPPEPAAAETRPPAPSNAYERSKATAELLARTFAQAGLPVIIGRPEFIYGPGDTHVLGLYRAIQRGIFFYVGHGRNVCHPTYIDDAVTGLLGALRQGRPGEIYHIAGPEPVSFKQLGQTIAAELGVAPPRLRLPQPLAWSGAVLLELLGKVGRFTPPLSRTGVAFFSESRHFNWQKAAQEFGYQPTYELAAGVAATVAWYREQGYL
ncbi:MAG: NAD-dependent epimerase/dehydratase family protein [Chloroflexota bacterium]